MTHIKENFVSLQDKNQKSKKMAQRESLSRQRLIVKKLQNNKRATLKEINDYLERESELLGYDLTTSKRTFHRDINEIRDVFRTDIAYNTSGRYYYIEHDDEFEINERLFEAMDVYNALRVTEQKNQHIYLDSRQPQGTEHLFNLLHAIKKRVKVSFTYQKFQDEKPDKRTVCPLALKEFKYRWYLVAKDSENDSLVKFYGLDRMKDLEVTKSRFPKDQNFDLNKMLKHCFGVTLLHDKKPEKVVLSFKPLDGKYIKSLPLHETQTILVDNKDELRISLELYLSNELKMEILSFGKNVKILEPKHFVKEMKTFCKEMLDLY